jgi:hypothetical protein
MLLSLTAWSIDVFVLIGQLAIANFQRMIVLEREKGDSFLLTSKYSWEIKKISEEFEKE